MSFLREKKRRLPQFGRSERLSAGFGLVEIMVAVVIGMLGIIVMMQVFTVFEGQKRTTTGSDDATTGGGLVIHELQRIIQESGWGINDFRIIGCPASGVTSAGSIDIPLVPVTINHPAITGQDANTDTLLVVSGNANDAVGGQVLRNHFAFSQTNYVVWAPTAFVQNDRVVAAPEKRAAPCLPGGALLATTILNVTTVNGGLTVGSAPFTVTSGDWLFNLGPQPTVLAYAIRGGNLTVCNYRVNNCGDVANNANSTVWVPIANQVVSMRAQYGRDTTDTLVGDSRMDGIADTWDQRSLWLQSPWVSGAVSTDSARDIPACALLRTVAVRVALLARSAQPERATGGVPVTVNMPVWMGSDPLAQAVNAANAAAVAFNLGAVATWPTWNDYRYKVFQTVIPLRNVTSRGAAPQC